MFWKIYAIVMTVILLIAYFFTFRYGMQTLDYVDLPVSIIALIGVYGFAFRIRLISYWIWRVWLLVVLGWNGYYNFYDALISVPEYSPFILTGMVLAFVVLVPEYIALFLYGFRSSSLWDKELKDTVA